MKPPQRDGQGEGQADGAARPQEQNTDALGIDARYHDALGNEHVIDDEARAAIRRAMGLMEGQQEGAASFAEHAVRVLVPGASRALSGPAELALEDGSTRPLDGELPADLPMGYHLLRPRGGGPQDRD